MHLYAIQNFVTPVLLFISGVDLPFRVVRLSCHNSDLMAPLFQRPANITDPKRFRVVILTNNKDLHKNPL
jgi:hypothetical protein